MIHEGEERKFIYSNVLLLQADTMDGIGKKFFHHSTLPSILRVSGLPDRKSKFVIHKADEKASSLFTRQT
jgi:hypothetical protein